MDRGITNAVRSTGLDSEVHIRVSIAFRVRSGTPERESWM